MTNKEFLLEEIDRLSKEYYRYMNMGCTNIANIFADSIDEAYEMLEKYDKENN